MNQFIISKTKYYADKQCDLETGGIDESEERDGKPSGESRGKRAVTRSGERNQEKAGGNEAESGDEERATLWNHFLHGHHSRAPEEEGRNQHRPFPH